MTKPNSEAIAEENLLRQGFDHYCPRFMQRLPNKTPQVRPLFPRYIFIFIEKAWYCLLGTRGISRILLGDNGPQILPTKIIEGLKQRTDHLGLVTLERRPKFAVGELVKAGSGLLTGHTFIYQGMSTHDRVHVLVNLLGGATLELEEKILAAA